MARLKTTTGDAIAATCAAVALAVVAAAILVAPPYLSPDSQHYCDIAHQIAKGLGPVSFDLHLASPAVPSANGLWPPGYPYALAGLLRVGLTETRAASAINALSFVVLGLAAYALGRSAALPRALAIPAAALAMAHPFVRAVHAHALSEPPYLALTYLTLALLAYGLPRRSLAALFAAGAAAGLAVTIRHAGLFVVAYGLIASVVFLLAARETLRRAALQLAVFFIGPLVVTPLALWTNLAVYGRPFGLARVSVVGPARGLVSRGSQLFSLLEPAESGLWVFALVAVVLWRFWRRGPEATEPGAAREPESRTALALVAGWIPFYCAALVASTYRVDTDAYDARLLSPVAPALVLLVAGLIALGPARRVRSASLVIVTVLIAAGAHVDAARRRILAPRQPEVAADLAAWARGRVADDALFVSSHGWTLRHETGAIVLEDGYPDMPRLSPDAVRDFVARTGGRFHQVFVMFQMDGTLRPESEDAYVHSFDRAGWTRTEARSFGAARIVGWRVQ